jgi:DNA-binding phage protein
MNIKMALRNISETFSDDLRDPEFIAAYLNDAARDEDPRVFLLALRRVVSAHDTPDIGGQPLVGPPSPLSDIGNPTYGTVVKLLHRVGVHLSVQPDGV